MKIQFVICCLLVVALAGCATQISPEITVVKWKGQMNIVDDQYRSTGSAEAVLGSFGRRLKSGTNRYQMDGILVREFKVRKPRVVNVSFKDITKMEKFGFQLSDQAKANLSGSKTKKGSYRLVVVKPEDPSVFEKTLLLRFEEDEFLTGKTKNPNFRFIDTVVFLVDYDGETETDWSVVGNAKINEIADEFSIDIEVGQDKTQKVRLPKSQVFAYQYRRLCWENGKIVDSVKDLVRGDAKACGRGDTKYPGKTKD